jgi:hypothetical protein
MLLAVIAFAVEPFKVKLTLRERYVVALILLPTVGSFATIKAIRELRVQLFPSDKEREIAGLEDLPTGGVTATNWLLVVEKEITFGKITKTLVEDALKRLDETKKLTEEHFTLYEKFIIIEEE